jgi:hypothetical protein
MIFISPIKTYLDYNIPKKIKLTNHQKLFMFQILAT